MATMLNRRGVRAGLGRVHAHLLRHAFAHTWLSEGGGRGRPHAPWGLADVGDARPLWGVGGRSACPRGSPEDVTRRSTLMGGMVADLPAFGVRPHSQGSRKGDEQQRWQGDTGHPVQ